MRRLVLLLALLPAASFAEVHYTVTPDLPAKSIRVKMLLDKAPATADFHIPAWCPGFYQVMDFEKKVSNVQATDEQGRQLQITKSGTRSWSVTNPRKTPIVFTYRVLGDDPGLGFFRVNVQPHTVFINGPAAFMWVDGRRKETHHLKLQLPPTWKIATGMTRTSETTYKGLSYDEFLDHPLQLGVFESREFKVGAHTFEAAYVSMDKRYGFDIEEQTERLRKLSAPAIKMFGGAPFKHFVYIIHLAEGDFAGGLEHRGSTVIAVSNAPRLNIDDLATHELFHVWNVKNIRPKQFEPFDYTQPVRTRSLWFLEGVTDYYAKLHAYQSGLQDQDWLFEDLSRQVADLQIGKTRLKKTVEDASWEAFDGNGFQSGDLDYYNKGLIVGLILDAAIRSQSDGEKSLDDVLRLMYTRYKLPKIGFEEADIVKTINEVAGTDLSALYKRLVQSTEEMPYEILELIGMRVRLPGDELPDMGFRTKGDVVERVSVEQEAAGLKIGDKVLRINGMPFTESVVSPARIGDNISVEVTRNLSTVRLELKVIKALGSLYRVERNPFASFVAKQRLREYLARPASS